MAMNQLRLAARGITKRFRGVTALDSVDFELLPGEVHGLVGENGAGKSTLIKVLTGVHLPDGGTITLDGRKVAFDAPHRAQAAGIACIYQEINLIPTLTAAENICIGSEPLTRMGAVNWRALQDRAEAIMQRFGLLIDLRRTVGSLGLAAQQQVAILRALSQGGRVLIMDEPTSALSDREVDQLLEITRQISASGVSVAYITHRLGELFRVTQRVTVLRDGRRILTEDTANLTHGRLVEAMLGRQDARVQSGTRPTPRAGGALTVENLSCPPRLRAATFAVRAGEVVGLAGLQGSGRSETMRTIFGADTARGGHVSVDGTDALPTTPATSLRRGVAFLPEDRKAQGIVPGLSLRENLTLIVLPALTRLGVVMRGRERAIVDQFIASLGIRAASSEVPIRDLSGGNQQKVLIARLLCTAPHYLLLDDPMRGIDIGAKAEIERLILELSEAGMGVLIASSELEEVLSLSDRVVVMREGRTEAAFDRADASGAAVMQAIAGDGGTGPR